MNKRKKKKSKQSINKLTVAQHRNEFFCKIQHICNVVGDSRVFSLIPSKDLDRMYKMRIRAIKIVIAEGHHVSPEVLKEIKQAALYMLKEPQIPTITEKLEITLYDYFSAGIILTNYLDIIKNSINPVEKEIFKGLSKIHDYDDTIYKAWDIFHNYLGLESLFLSDLSSHIYWFKYSKKPQIHENFFVCSYVELYSHQPEKIQVNFEGNKRTAFRVGWGFSKLATGMKWSIIKSENFNLKNSIPGLPLEVYVQTHALQRLSERLDCILKGILHLHIYLSFENIKSCKDKFGNTLIEYWVSNYKLGYFVVDISEGKAIIRTFLFLTNNGTPEGEKLKEITGLEKLDKKYLTIDKLSTFLSPDIYNNENLKKIFVKAGCGSLFDIDNKSSGLPDSLKNKHSIAMMIEQYLGLNINSQ